MSADKQLPPYKVDRTKMLDGKGDHRTRGLFKEAFSRETTEAGPIFTLKDYDLVEEGLYSFKRLYLQFDDPTEYEQAMFILGSFVHWEKVVKAQWVRDIVDECRKELKARIKGRAVSKISELADNSVSDAVRLQAQKFLCKEGYRLMEGDPEPGEKVGKGRGRPSKDELDGELKRMAKEEKQVMDDYRRAITQLEQINKTVN